MRKIFRPLNAKLWLSKDSIHTHSSVWRTSASWRLIHSISHHPGSTHFHWRIWSHRSIYFSSTVSSNFSASHKHPSFASHSRCASRAKMDMDAQGCQALGENTSTAVSCLSRSPCAGMPSKAKKGPCIWMQELWPYNILRARAKWFHWTCSFRRTVGEERYSLAVSIKFQIELYFETQCYCSP